MSELNAAEIEELRAMLLHLRQELQGQLQDMRAAVKPVSLDEPIGRVSRMDAIQQQKMAQANKRKSEARLQKIHAALAEIDRDEYGECKRCEEPIAHKRLRAHPESRFCRACQQASESR